MDAEAAWEVQTAERRTSAAIVVSIAPFFIGSVERAAHRVFTRLGVAHTLRRSGVLVLVVPARNEVVVLCDKGAEGCADCSVWHEVATEIANAFSRGDGTLGLVDGVTRLAHALSGSFPYEREDVATFEIIRPRSEQHAARAMQAWSE